MRDAVHPALARTGDGICASSVFELPTRVIYGRGVSSTVGEEARSLGGARALLVTDPGIQAVRLDEGVLRALEEAGIAIEVFDRVQANPRDVHSLEGAERAGRFAADVIVGLGGGSSIDTAKCIAVLQTNGGHPRDWEGFGALEETPRPVIAIPTTAGSGSEVSPSAIITDTVRRKKMNLFDPRICPEVALVDPDLTFSAPPALSAASGMDALSHAVDSLHSRLAMPASEAMALEGARLVARYLRRACQGGADIEARCGMAQASLTAGLAVAVTDVSGCHCLAEAIGAVYDHPHGVCCAVTLPVVMEYNLDVSAGKYARLARAFEIEDASSEEEAARAAIDVVRRLNDDLEIPALHTLIDPADLDLLGEKAAANTSAPSNPRAAAVSDFRAMLEYALEADTRV